MVARNLISYCGDSGTVMGDVMKEGRRMETGGRAMFSLWAHPKNEGRSGGNTAVMTQL